MLNMEIPVYHIEQLAAFSTEKTSIAVLNNLIQRVAWRSDEMPAYPKALLDQVRGVAPANRA